MVGDKRSLKENIYSLVVGFVPGADLPARYTLS